MINPMKLMQLKSSWDSFRNAHPKFVSFLNAVPSSGITEGSIIEITVSNPNGKTLSTNLKLKESDIQMFNVIKELGQ